MLSENCWLLQFLPLTILLIILVHRLNTVHVCVCVCGDFCRSEVVRVLIDVVLPGRVTEFHDMGGSLGKSL